MERLAAKETDVSLRGWYRPETNHKVKGCLKTSSPCQLKSWRYVHVVSRTCICCPQVAKHSSYWNLSILTHNKNANILCQGGTMLQQLHSIYYFWCPFPFVLHHVRYLESVKRAVDMSKRMLCVQCSKDGSQLKDSFFTYACGMDDWQC